MSAVVALFGGALGFAVAIVGLILLVIGLEGRLMWDGVVGLALFVVGCVVTGRALSLMGVIG